MENNKKDFKIIQNHLKNSGFIYQGSKIYGGLSNTWDYGPLGVALINNIKNLWWKEFIIKEPNNYGLDSKILMNPKVWEASGHLQNFSDFLIENKINGKRYRADYIIKELYKNINVEKMSIKEMEDFIDKNIKKYKGNKTKWSHIKKFNLMFQTKQGPTNDSKSLVYLRPETAQGIFINFKNVQRSLRLKLPFGIGQIGKSFRNEVTPSNFIFRTREFEQMELEKFVVKNQSSNWYKKCIQKSKKFIKMLGIKDTSIRTREHSHEELAHYAKKTTDIEFNFPFGWGELLGIANREDFDLKNHIKKSGEKLEYLDSQTNQKIIPHVIETSIGLDRLALAIIVDAYEEEKIENKKRIVLKISKFLSPYQIAILPLNQNYHLKKAEEVFTNLISKGIRVTFDKSGSIGKRYRRQDGIGTPICMTIFDDTLSSEKVTIRFIKDMKQKEIKINELIHYL